MALIMEKKALSSFNEPNDTSTSDTSTSFLEPISLKVIVPLTVIYVIILITGILGNISTCIVIARNRFMHTSTIFYLFGLAISDLLILICGLPFEIYRLQNYHLHPFEKVLCVSIGLISETSANATVLIIVMFTMEIYISICHPFMFQRKRKSTIVRYIIKIWLCALCSAVPQVMQFDIVTYEANGQMLSACTIKRQGEQLVFFISSFGFFALPMSLIIILYAMIGTTLFTSRVLHPVKNCSVERVERSKVTPRYKNRTTQKKVIGILAAVALSFFLCWMPFHVQRMIAIYGKNLEQPTDIFYKIYVVLTYLSGVFCYLSTSIKPILYIIMSNKFRNAFKVTFTSWCSRRDRPRMERTISAVLASQRQSTAVRALQRTPHPRSQKSDSLTSPHSISNSSLREVNQELNSEELATYSYEVNRKITGKIYETTV